MLWKEHFTDEQLERRKKQQSEYRRRVRRENTSEERAKAAAWRVANRDKIAGYNRQSWAVIKADAEKLEQHRRRHRAENMSQETLEKKRERGRLHSYRLTKEALERGTTLYQETLTPASRKRDTLKMKKWRADNPERSRAIGRAATQQYRYKRGPRANIDNCAYKTIRMALVAADAKSKFFPGYTGKDLKAHILGNLPNGWTLADYGSKWEIDHIIPISAFDYQTVEDEQYRRCWSLENLQPLCKIKNRRKGGVKSMF